MAGPERVGAFERGGVDLLAGRRPNSPRASPGEPDAQEGLERPDDRRRVGNAYSDEILHRARLSPFTLTGGLTEDEIQRCKPPPRATLTGGSSGCGRSRGRVSGKVTAFRPEMAVHGKYGQPCPVCGAPVQRIVYAENEANYCPGCQTGGRILAPPLSRLLKDDWPRTIEDLERLPGAKEARQ